MKSVSSNTGRCYFNNEFKKLNSDTFLIVSSIRSEISILKHRALLIQQRIQKLTSDTFLIVNSIRSEKYSQTPGVDISTEAFENIEKKIKLEFKLINLFAIVFEVKLVEILTESSKFKVGWSVSRFSR